MALLTKHLGEYKSDPKAADAVVHIGLAPVPEGIDHAELAPGPVCPRHL